MICAHVDHPCPAGSLFVEGVVEECWDPCGVDSFAEVALGVAGESGAGVGACCGGAGHAEEWAQFAEVFAWSQGGAMFLSAVGEFAHDIDCSFLDDIDEVGVVALAEQDLSGGDFDVLGF